MDRETQHEIQRLVLVPANHVSVEIEENQGGKDCRPLVAIDESVVQHERVKQCGCLAGQIWLGVGAESTSLRPGDGRFQESLIPPRMSSAHYLGVDFQNLFDSEEAHRLVFGQFGDQLGIFLHGALQGIAELVA